MPGVTKRVWCRAQWFWSMIYLSKSCLISDPLWRLTYQAVAQRGVLREWRLDTMLRGCQLEFEISSSWRKDFIIDIVTSPGQDWTVNSRGIIVNTWRYLHGQNRPFYIPSGSVIAWCAWHTDEKNKVGLTVKQTDFRESWLSWCKGEGETVMLWSNVVAVDGDVASALISLPFFIWLSVAR